MSEMAFSLAFLPQYFANARGNPAVGLHRALVDLIAERLTLANVGGLLQPQIQQKRTEMESERDDIAAHILRRFNRFFDSFGGPQIVPCDELEQFEDTVII